MPAESTMRFCAFFSSSMGILKVQQNEYVDLEHFYVMCGFPMVCYIKLKCIAYGPVTLSRRLVGDHL